jgi:hypothetical protein
MSRMHNATLSIVLIFSALALSACATKSQEAAVAEPAPVAAAPEEAPAAAPAPEAVAEQPAPAVAAERAAFKPVVKKTKKRVAKAAPPKAAPVEPVVAPAPVVKQEVPEAAPPAPAVVVQPAPKPATKGFLEQYWMWLLGLVIAAIAVLWMNKKD